MLNYQRVSWFISPSNYSYKYHKPYSYWSYVHQLSYRLGAPLCRWVQEYRLYHHSECITSGEYT